MMNELTHAIVLVAGRGRRLRPFTDHTPKPLLAVNGRPMLDSTLTALQNAGVTDVCLVTHYLAEQIEAFVGDGSKWQMNASFCRQEEMLGTGHAVQTAVSFITAPCFIVAGDYFLPPTYFQELKVSYLQSGASLGVSLKQMSAAELSRRSSVRFDGNGRIVEIVEKPLIGTAPSHFGASLIYIVPPQINTYLAQLQKSERDEYELQSCINLMLHDGFSMHGLLQSTPREWEPA